MSDKQLCPAQIQLQKLTSSFQSVTEDMKRRFAVAGEPLIEEAGPGGKSPRLGSFYRQTDFVIPTRPTLASSGMRAVICAGLKSEVI